MIKFPIKAGMMFLSAATLLTGVTVSAYGQAATASEKAISPAKKPSAHDEKMAWWRDARFGMFIHWGVYSVPAGRYEGKEVDGLGEWIMHDAKIPRATYQQFAGQFNPVNYDPDAWVRLAKEAGVKYIVITSKHHDGFAMFDSKASDWNVVKATPYGKDLIKPLAEACRKYGMKLGLYYSQANDWNNPGGAAAGGHWDSTQNGSMDDYIDKVAIPQVKEILTQYGDIAEIWWDVPTGMTKERADKFLPLLALQPGIVSNNRLGEGFKGDIETPEQYIPATGIPGRDWETCMTMNDTWGFKTDDQNWKSAETLIRNLIDIASKGGNYLLNIGPTSAGTIPEAIVERLKAIGAWMHVNGESIYGTSASPFAHLDWGRCTKKVYPGGATLYLQVFNWPANGKLLLPGLHNPALSAALLNGGAVLHTQSTPAGLVIQLPAQASDTIATVIKVKVQGELNVTVPVAKPLTAGTDGAFLLKAEQADLHPSASGDAPKVEGDPGNANIGFWTDPQSWVSWKIKVDKPGTYLLKVMVATPATGSELKVSGASAPGDIHLAGTGDYQKYTEEEQGTVTLSKPGINIISFHPVDGAWSPVNIKYIRLEPAM